MTIMIETERLYLRTWQPLDIESYWEINQDPRVIEFLLGSLTIDEVKQFIIDKNQQQAKRGYTLWATELKATGELIGFIGLNYTDWETPFTPAVEVGWRLGSAYWNHGYATEGAKAALAFGFNTIGLNEIVSFTMPMNFRSVRVMEKIGLHRDKLGDFRHPKLASNHPLLQHILYRLNKIDFLRTEL